MIIAHSGGGFAGSVEKNGPLAAWYSKILGVRTFDVEYRLAPEAK
jgi:acetyl esterase/lipase